MHEDQNEKLVKLSSVFEQLDIQYSTLHPQLNVTFGERDAEGVSPVEANFDMNDTAGLVRIIKYLKDMKSELQQENTLLNEELLTVKTSAEDEKTNFLFQKVSILKVITFGTFIPILPICSCVYLINAF